MLRKYFCKQSTLPAKILLIYMIWGLFFIPINAGVPLNYVRILLIDDNFSLLPFIYCVLILTFLWLPFIYFSNKYLILNEKLILLYGFLYIYLAMVTIWAWMHTERGWEPLILIGGLMFFASRYFFLFCVSALFIIFYFNKKQHQPEIQLSHPQKTILILFLLTYLSCFASLAFILKKYDVSLLENTPKEKIVPWDCPISTDIKQIKSCLNDKIENKQNSFSYNWHKFVVWLRQGKRNSNPKTFNHNFKEATPIVIPNFQSIKACYNKDQCIFSSKYVSKDENINYDRWKDMYLRTENWTPFKFYAKKDEQQIITYIPQDKFSHIYEPIFKHCSESFLTQSKDGILAQDNGKNAIFAVGNEYLSLPNDNYFMIFSIVKFVENHIDKYGSPHFIYQNGYKFYTTCHGEKCYNKNVKISLNRRIDPQYALIKFDNKTYQINLQ